MLVLKINEAGFSEAMLGLSLSYKVDVVQPQTVSRLAKKDGGHNKFLESIITWWDVKAPRYWWQEADTYRLSTKQSESTMHTLIKELKELPEFCLENRDLYDGFNHANFTSPIEINTIGEMRARALANDIRGVKALLPEGYLQRRIWLLSYKELRHIIAQRHDHRLPEWQTFCQAVKEQVIYPNFLE